MAAWAPLLSRFGLAAGSTWGPVAVLTALPMQANPASSLDDGVSTLAWGYGQTVSVLAGAPAGVTVLSADWGRGNWQGVIGVAQLDAGAPQGVPEPASAWLAALGLLAMKRRRRTG